MRNAKGQFLKGFPHQLGYVHTPEAKKKMSLARKGKPSSRKGVLGKYKHTEETKLKISEINKRIGLRPPLRKGVTLTLAHRLKLSEAHKGEKAWNWKGGITPINKQIRKSPEYKAWREAVFKRDDWTCVNCHKRGGVLNPDHIKQFALYPELRFDINNGRTLCIDCHRMTPTYGRNL